MLLLLTGFQMPGTSMATTLRRGASSLCHGPQCRRGDGISSPATAGSGLVSLPPDTPSTEHRYHHHHHHRHLKSYQPHQLGSLLALCEGNPLVTGGFPSQRASNVELIDHDNSPPRVGTSNNIPRVSAKAEAARTNAYLFLIHVDIHHFIIMPLKSGGDVIIVIARLWSVEAAGCKKIIDIIQNRSVLERRHASA